MRRIHSRRRSAALGVVLGGLLVAGLAACGNSGTSTAKGGGGSNSAVDIGVILSTSGVDAPLGVPEEEAIQAFANAHKTVNGHPIHYIIKNDQTNPTLSAADAKVFLAKQSVVGLIGGVDSAPVLGMAPVLVGQKLPWMMLVPQPSNSYVSDKYVFWANNGNVVQQSKLFINFMQQHGASPADTEMIISNDATGQTFAPIFKANGIRNITEVPDSVTDFTPLLSSLRREGRKGILVIESSEQSADIRKGEAAIGWKPPTVLDVNGLNGSFLSIAGSAANGTYSLANPSIAEPSSIPDPAQRKVSVSFQNAFHAATGHTAVNEGVLAGIGWDAAESFYLAVEHATSVTREGVDAAMLTQSFDGSAGMVMRTPNNPQDPYRSGFSLSSYIFVEIENGKAVEVH